MRTLAGLIVFMLLTMTCAHAQSNTKDPEVLRGLKGLRLTVYFGRAPAMEAEQRSVVQKMLQAEAEAKFTKAGIPLLKFTQETEKEPGSPHFVVTLTLDKPNGYVFPVVSDARLFQKVRLSRDPSVEVSVSTWETHGVGVYNIKDLDMLRLQVNQAVDEFIKYYQTVNPDPR